MNRRKPVNSPLPDVARSYFKSLESAPDASLAVQVVERLHKEGFVALLAGGCVRDLLLGRAIADFDVATNADPSQVEALFEKTIAVGKKFGVIVVVDANSGAQVEVGRFREDGPYVDGRHPSEVHFSDEEFDAQRRDFTINALFLDVRSMEVIDYVEGLEDLQKKVIRAVGQPETRLQEDYLRILRALRFQSQLGFVIESGLKNAIEFLSEKSLTVSRERFFREWDLLLDGLHCKEVVAELISNHAMEKFWPGTHWQLAKWELFSKDICDWLAMWATAFAAGTSKTEIEKNWKSLKVSKEWERAVALGMKCFFDSKFVSEAPMGQLVQYAIDPPGLRGLLLFTDLNSNASLQKKTKEVLRLHASWGGQWPIPLLNGDDLKQTRQGRALGAALSAAYWAQLERRITTKEQALSLVEKMEMR